MQRQEVYALFLGVLHLLEAGRHLGLRAPVDKRHFGAQSLGSAARVHGRVASADHEHVLAEVYRRVGSRVGGVHQVDPREVFV